MTTGYVFLPTEGGGGGTGNILSINGNTAANQFIVSGSGIGVSSGAGITTVSLVSPVAIVNGGTGQSNAQAALNNLFDQPAHSNGDVAQLIGGNVQLTPLVLTLADISGAIGAPPNSFVFTDAGSQIVGYSNWHIDPATFFSNIDNFLHPDNLGVYTPAYSWNVNVAPLQNSPNDSMRLQSFTVNLDTSAAGFDFGSNGQAAELLGGGYNYGGNGATIGTLRHINLFSGFGNGTDPGTFNGIVASSHAFNFSANTTLDGAVTGHDFNLNLNASAITTSNFQILWMSDFSQIPVDLYGYQGTVCQPTISTLKNGHNFAGSSVSPTITLMEGNAGFFGFPVGGTITTLGTSGYSAYPANTNIGTIPAGSNFYGVSFFNQITTIAATANFHGSAVSPTITTLNGSFNGAEYFPQITGGIGDVKLITGSMGSVTTSGQTSVLSLNGTTADGKQSVFSADGVNMNIGGTLTATSGAGIASQHVIFTSFVVPDATTITGTDFLMNILSPDVDFGDATSVLDPGGFLGQNAFVAFAGQMHGSGTATGPMCALLAGAIFSEDFTLAEWRGVNSIAINGGFTGSVTNASAFYHEVGGAGLFATNHWGLRVVTEIDNYVTQMAIGTTTQKVTNASVALEIGGTTKAFVNSNLTTTERLALTALPGMQVFDTTLNQMAYYNGTTWVIY